MKNHIVLFLILGSIISCGKNRTVWPTAKVSTKSIEPAISEKFTYQFSGIKCSTGAQSAATFFEICKVLQDDELNDACAQDKREELYINADCPGSFR